MGKRRRRQQALASAASTPQQLRPPDPAAKWVALSAMATLCVCLLTAWMAFETHRGVNETSRATRAGVWGSLLAEYGSPEMLVSMKALRDWQKSRKETFGSDFKALLLKIDKSQEELQEAASLDGHRRRVSSFFNKVRMLAEAGVIEEAFVSSTWATSTRTFIDDVLLPIDAAKVDAMAADGSLRPIDVKTSIVNRTKLKELFTRAAAMTEAALTRR
jgi:hypothetical protein